MSDEGTTTGIRPVGLQLPLQAAPVDRGAAAGTLGAGGVEADIFGLDLDDILGGIKTGVDIATKAAPIVKGIGGLLGI